MLETRHLTPKTFAIQPWKNGLGETREIALDSQRPYRWRVSQATLSGDCPFSLFPGYKRTIVLLEGDSVEIQIEGKERRPLVRLLPFTFSGNLPAQVFLNGRGEDFNLFIKEGAAKGALYPAHMGKGEDYQFPLAGNEHLIYCTRGKLKVFERNLNKTFKLSQGEILMIRRTDKEEYLNVKAVAHEGEVSLLWGVIHLLN